MDKLLRFGSGNQLYVFPTNQQITLQDNFRDLVQKVTQIPGVSGGISEYGLSAPPRAIGNVQCLFQLIVDTTATEAEQNAEMQLFKDKLGEMSSYGVKRLYKQPTDTSRDEMYCYASINRVSYTETSNTQLSVQINWQVTNPVWYTSGTEAPAWGDGSFWGDGLYWGGGAPQNLASNQSTQFTITTNCNAEVYPRIVITTPAGKTCENIAIQRIVGGVVVNEIQYNDIITDENQIIVNTRNNTVRKDGLSHYVSAFVYKNSEWFKLLPGDNNIRVLMKNQTDESAIEFRFYEAHT